MDQIRGLDALIVDGALTSKGLNDRPGVDSFRSGDIFIGGVSSLE